MIIDIRILSSHHLKNTSLSAMMFPRESFLNPQVEYRFLASSTQFYTRATKSHTKSKQIFTFVARNIKNYQWVFIHFKLYFKNWDSPKNRMDKSDYSIRRINRNESENVEIQSNQKCCVFKNVKGDFYLAFKKDRFVNIRLLSQGKTIYLKKFTGVVDINDACLYKYILFEI